MLPLPISCLMAGSVHGSWYYKIWFQNLRSLSVILQAGVKSAAPSFS